MKERLSKLLKDIGIEFSDGVADYLIANGVTVPEVHARWQTRGSVAYCSNCGRSNQYLPQTADVCEHCRAKMDLEAVYE